MIARIKITLFVSIICLLFPAFVFANYFTLPVDITGEGHISAWFDHDMTASTSMTKYTGEIFSGAEADFDTCDDGCYDEHNGTDFATTTGAIIQAPADGEVKDIWWNNFNGWAMHIWHNDIGFSTLYAHIGTTTIATTTDIVSRLDPIAYVDSTGITSGPHLHFGVVDGQELTGNRIDPFGWWTSTSTDPWSYNLGYLWTTDPPSFNLANEVTGYISTTTWRGNYVVDGTVTVNSVGTLTVEPSTVVKFKTDTSKLTVNGILDSQGTNDRNIYFTSYKDDSVGGDTNGDATSTTPTAGDWGGIITSANASSTLSYITALYGGKTGAGQPFAIVRNDGGQLALTNAVVESAASSGSYHVSGTTTITSSELNSNQNYGLSMNNAGTVSISDSVFSDNGLYGIHSAGGGLTVSSTTFSGNTNGIVYFAVQTDFIHSNNTATGTGKRAFVTGGSYATDRTWSPDNDNNDISYVIDGDMTIDNGATLTIDPGTVVKFNSNTSRLVLNNGSLNAEGATTSRIYFTSIKDDSVGGDTNGDGAGTSPAVGDWREIALTSGTNATISNTTIRYGGYFKFRVSINQANIYNNGGEINFSYASSTNAKRYGITTAAGTTTALFSEFADSLYGLYISGTGNVFVASSTIHDNSSYGLYNSTAATTTAENNYWGASDGPSGEGPGSGDAVSTKVDYDPWLTTWP